MFSRACFLFIVTSLLYVLASSLLSGVRVGGVYSSLMRWLQVSLYIALPLGALFAFMMARLEAQETRCDTWDTDYASQLKAWFLRRLIVGALVLLGALVAWPAVVRLPQGWLRYWLETITTATFCVSTCVFLGSSLFLLATLWSRRLNEE
ncbi:hypothetical protein D6833_03035 [Candidatus Parcubacteria bacterium]|nr:MAG: hypothetical protein D6833_03035 [Candidatus Parcubacteria bacterium]